MDAQASIFHCEDFIEPRFVNSLAIFDHGFFTPAELGSSHQDQWGRVISESRRNAVSVETRGSFRSFGSNVRSAECNS